VLSDPDNVVAALESASFELFGTATGLLDEDD